MRVQPLRCCVCIGLKDDEKPEGYLGLELTIINGNIVCTEHGNFAGPNTTLNAWIQAEYARGRRQEDGR
jgi:hypothetical protein